MTFENASSQPGPDVVFASTHILPQDVTAAAVTLSFF